MPDISSHVRKEGHDYVFRGGFCEIYAGSYYQGAGRPPERVAREKTDDSTEEQSEQTRGVLRLPSYSSLVSELPLCRSRATLQRAGSSTLPEQHLPARYELRWRRRSPAEHSLDSGSAFVHLAVPCLRTRLEGSALWETPIGRLDARRPRCAHA